MNPQFNLNYFAPNMFGLKQSKTEDTNTDK